MFQSHVPSHGRESTASYLSPCSIPVHQASLLGSVFSNMLLVLGCCFFFGGINHKEQRFNSTSAIANMSLLLLSSLALVLPTPLSHAAVSEERGGGGDSCGR